MTHLTPGGETRPAPPLLSPAPLGIDRARLRDAIAERRSRVATIETVWVAACERAAARHLPRGIRLEDRATWDKPMWDRYLAAAASSEAQFMPRMRQLYDEIARLERLHDPLPAPARAA